MPERRPQVFVSHSSRTDAARARLRAFVAALEQGEDRVDVLHDKEIIREGLPWRDAIDSMLAQCDAAVVLVTDDALDSAWVLKEATILRWRYDQEYDHADDRPGFALVPVLWAGAGRDRLARHPLWGPIDLPAIQDAQADDPATLAATVKAHLAPMAARLKPSPMDLIAEDIAERLSAAGPLRLQETVAALGAAAPRGLRDKRDLAYAISRWALEKPPPALSALAGALDRLSLPDERTMEIIDALAHLWVASEAAVWLLRADHRREDCRDLAIACRYPDDTVNHYVQRAHRPWRPPALIALNGVSGGDQERDVTAELRDELRRRMPQLRTAPDDVVDRRLAQTARRFFVTLPLPDDPAVVAGLQRTYPRVTFIFTLPPAREGTAVPAGVEWIEPPLDADLEEDVWQDFFDATNPYAAA